MLRLLTAAWLACGIPAQDAYFPEDVDRVEVPLEVVDHGDAGIDLFVRVRLGEVTGRFCLDTGANLAIDETFAATVRASKRSKVIALGITAVDMPHTYRLESLEIGGVELENYLAVGIDLSGFDADGLIGFDLLGAAVVEIDVPGERLVLHEPDSFEPPADTARIPLAADLFSVLCPGVIGPLPSQRWIVDTGNSGTILLHAPFVRKHGLAQQCDGLVKQPIAGVFGQSHTYLGRLGELRLGDITFVGFPVELADPEATGGSSAGGVQAGNLGAGLFSTLVVTLDGRRRAMFLRAVDGARRVVHRDTLGIQLMTEDDSVVVLDVVPGSPAAGPVEPGDVIVAVDGKPAQAQTAVARWLRSADEVELSLRRSGLDLRVELVREAWLPEVEITAPKKRRR